MMRRAFTLIEMMICIALLSIMLAGDVHVWQSLVRLRRQGDYAQAARNAEIQLRRLQTTPFESLPPQLLRPDPRGWVQLGQTDMDESTLRVRPLQGSPQALRPLQIEAVGGRFRVDTRWAGQALLVDYDYFACDENETHRLPSSGPLFVPLLNQPVVRVARVMLARGDELVPLNDWHFSIQRGLEVGEKARGQVVVVDYLGQRVGNRVRGEFLDEQLRPQDTPSPLKLMIVGEKYAGHESLLVSGLRVQTR